MDAVGRSKCQCGPQVTTTSRTKIQSLVAGAAGSRGSDPALRPFSRADFVSVPITNFVTMGGSQTPRVPRAVLLDFIPRIICRRNGHGQTLLSNGVQYGNAGLCCARMWAKNNDHRHEVTTVEISEASGPRTARGPSSRLDCDGAICARPSAQGCSSSSRAR